MTTKLTQAYVSVQHRLANREAGQGALEYIGILAVVALVITIAIAGFNGARSDILQGVKDLVDKVFTAGG